MLANQIINVFLQLVAAQHYFCYPDALSYLSCMSASSHIQLTEIEALVTHLWQ